MSRVSTATNKPKVSGTSVAARHGTGKQSSQANKISDDADRYRMIATAAYYRAEQRGFMGGDPVQDWLAAEAEISRLYH